MGGLTSTVSMSGLTVAIITVVALVVCIFLGEKLKSNIGVLALIAASVLGIFVFGMRPSAIYNYWPISITLQMIVVIFFYGFAIANGTAQYMADWAIYAARKVPALLPFVFFVVDFGMMAIGINPGAVTVFLVPIFMQICYKSKVSEMVIMAGHCLALAQAAPAPSVQLASLSEACLIYSVLRDRGLFLGRVSG